MVSNSFGHSIVGRPRLHFWYTATKWAAHVRKDNSCRSLVHQDGCLHALLQKGRYEAGGWLVMGFNPLRPLCTPGMLSWNATEYIVSPDCHWALGSRWSRRWPRREMNGLLRALAFHGKTPICTRLCQSEIFPSFLLHVNESLKKKLGS